MISKIEIKVRRRNDVRDWENIEAVNAIAISDCEHALAIAYAQQAAIDEGCLIVDVRWNFQGRPDEGNYEPLGR